MTQCDKRIEDSDGVTVLRCLREQGHSGECKFLRNPNYRSVRGGSNFR